MNIKELKNLVECGDFDNLIGKIENEWFECKKAPYYLKNHKQKRELAKDIAGLANSGGGLILLGVKTERNELHHGDEVVEICSFDQSLVNHNDYINVVNSWVYPNLINLEIKWFKSAKENQRGIVVITVPKQPDSLKPFLLTRTFDENQKLIEILFGYCERKRDSVESLNVERIHAIIKDGFRFEEISQRIDSIETALHKIIDHGIEATNKSIEDKRIFIKNSAEELLIAAGLKENPYFVLAITPSNQVNIKGIFEGREAEVVKLIDSPPKLRYGGFDLDTIQVSEIIEGKKRRSIEKNFNAIELWKDGTIIFVANAGPKFLSWGSYDEQKVLKINDNALIEVCYLFCLLVEKLLPFFDPDPENFIINIQLKKLPTKTKRCIVLGTQRQILTYAKSALAPGPEVEFSFQLKSVKFSPGISSFKLASRVYEWFGVEHDKIPLVVKKENEYQVDPVAIQNLG